MGVFPPYMKYDSDLGFLRPIWMDVEASDLLLLFPAGHYRQQMSENRGVQRSACGVIASRGRGRHESCLAHSGRWDGRGQIKMESYCCRGHAVLKQWMQHSAPRPRLTKISAAMVGSPLAQEQWLCGLAVLTVHPCCLFPSRDPPHTLPLLPSFPLPPHPPLHTRTHTEQNTVYPQSFTDWLTCTQKGKLLSSEALSVFPDSLTVQQMCPCPASQPAALMINEAVAVGV